MAVATAQAEAKKAEAEKAREEAEGQRRVMKAKYEQEEKKVAAEVEAEKEKVVATIQATQRLEVAELDKQAAELEKQKTILLGEGQATAKKLVLAADGALQQKLSTYEKVMGIWAEAYARRQVPQLVMGGAGGGAGGNTAGGIDTNTLNFNQGLSLLVLDKLGLDLNFSKGPVVQPKK